MSECLALFLTSVGFVAAFIAWRFYLESEQDKYRLGKIKRFIDNCKMGSWEVVYVPGHLLPKVNDYAGSKNLKLRMTSIVDTYEVVEK